MTTNVARAAKLAAKYGPHVVAAAKVAGPAVKDAAETQRRRLENRRAAFDKARGLADGSVLRQREGDEVVFVVFTGEEPVAVYPDVATPLADLVRNADLSQRVTPEQHDAAKVRARAARTARGAADRVRSARRRGDDAPAELEA